MVKVVIAASRRALAAFVLFAAVMLAVYVWRLSSYGPLSVGGGPKAEPPVIAHKIAAGWARFEARACVAGHTENCSSLRPGWAVPVAVAIMLSGVVLAALIHWRRRGRAELRAVNLGPLKPAVR